MALCLLWLLLLRALLIRHRFVVEDACRKRIDIEQHKASERG